MPKRLAVVNQRQCVACGVCENACPMGAVAVYRGCYAVVNAECCVGCGKCSRECPTGCIEMKVREEV